MRHLSLAAKVLATVTLASLAFGASAAPRDGIHHRRHHVKHHHHVHHPVAHRVHGH